MTYLVELKHISNGNYEMPSHLEKFEVRARDMDETIKIITAKLSRHMLDKDGYHIEAGYDYENYADISFGDAETGLDVCYTITKYL